MPHWRPARDQGTQRRLSHRDRTGGRPGGLRRAAASRERVRIRGTVIATGEGRSGSYTNTWQRIQTTAGVVQVTAAHSSPLGTATIGTRVELACDLTGVVDLAQGFYVASRARLLSRS